MTRSGFQFVHSWFPLLRAVNGYLGRVEEDVPFQIAPLDGIALFGLPGKVLQVVEGRFDDMLVGCGNDACLLFGVALTAKKEAEVILGDKL